MGVKDLWPELQKQPSAAVVSLTHLSVTSAIKSLDEHDRLPRIGIDASPWLYEAQGAVIAARHAGASWAHTGESAEISALRKWIEQLILLPLSPVLFFDGDRRPQEKRNTRVFSATHPLIPPLKQLAEDAGFATYTAQGEAEADLAYFNKRGDLDFVMTSDSDIVMFGARNVIRSPRNSQNWDEVEFYPVAEMRDKDARLSPSGMVFTALLSGADYDPLGLRGCGFPTTYALAGTHLASDLFNALLSFRKRDLAAANQQLCRFRQDLRDELMNNTSHVLASRHRSLSTQIPDTFPDLDIANLYAFPVTSATIPPFRRNLAISSWQMRLPDTDRMIDFYAAHYPSWEWRAVFNRLRSYAWTGTCIHQLLKPGLELPAVNVRNSVGCLGVTAIMGIASQDKNSEPAYQDLPFPMLKVNLCLTSVSTHAVVTFKNQTNKPVTPRQGVNAGTGVIIIPEPVLRRAVPNLVDEFRHQSSLSQIRKRKQPPSSAVCAPAKKPCHDKTPSRILPSAPSVASSSELQSTAGPSSGTSNISGSKPTSDQQGHDTGHPIEIKATPPPIYTPQGSHSDVDSIQSHTRLIREGGCEIIEILDEL
ncbi:PIN domain-like protein [Coprinopsis sp. MPI-PUGE-AT-0042]|nr:PIN domain-like protein [Coprinopsis sp. MPI-PUGE-AT-0042]